MSLSDWITLSSSNLDAYRYDPDTQELQVRFKTSGLTYSYADVPQDVAQGLGSADSAGKYFAQSIKGAYTFTIAGITPSE